MKIFFLSTRAENFSPEIKKKEPALNMSKKIILPIVTFAISSMILTPNLI